MTMDEPAALARLEAARVGRLATADATGVPHVVPFVFVLHGRTVYWAVDSKPKRSPNLKRLENIRVNPNVEMVVDAYDEDWGSLWWVRASGTATIVEDGGLRARALSLLAEKYTQYADHPPAGPVVAIDVGRVSWWEAQPPRPVPSKR
jgi:PPOX class probable F420-dependent enzyme